MQCKSEKCTNSKKYQLTIHFLMKWQVPWSNRQTSSSILCAVHNQSGLHIWEHAATYDSNSQLKHHIVINSISAKWLR